MIASVNVLLPFTIHMRKSEAFVLPEFIHDGYRINIYPPQKVTYHT